MEFLKSKLIILNFSALTFALILASPLLAQAPPQPAQNQPAANASIVIGRCVAEQGKFILHKFENPIGEETFQIVRDGNSLNVKMEFKFTDRGTPVPLSATFRGSEDLTPEAFEIKGQNSRSTSIDEAGGGAIDPGSCARPRQMDRVCPPRTIFHYRRLRSGNHADAHGPFLGFAQFACRTGYVSFRTREN